MTSIAPINKSVPVLEGKNNFLSGIFLRWLQSVESKLNNSIISDDYGNTAVGGATIPSDVYKDGDVKQEFKPFNSVNVYTATTRQMNLNNYIAEGYVVKFLDDTKPAYIELNQGVQIDRLSAPANIGGNPNFTTIYVQLDTGNVNIKTGATYTATL